MSERKYNFTFRCETSKELEHVNGTSSTFTCPSCGLVLKYLEKTRKLGANGKTEKTLGHALRAVEEL